MRDWVLLVVGGIGFFASGIGVGYLVGKKEAEEKYDIFSGDLSEDLFDRDEEESYGSEKPWYAENDDSNIKEVTRNFVNGSVSRQVDAYKDKIMNQYKDLYSIEDDEDDEVEGFTEYDLIDDNGTRYRMTREGAIKIVPPYFITEEEYFETCRDFEKTTLVYWAKDDIVANEADEVIDGWRNVLRDDMPEGFETEEMVYVRNVEINTDFEIYKRDDSYLKVVRGIEPYTSQEEKE